MLLSKSRNVPIVMKKLDGEFYRDRMFWDQVLRNKYSKITQNPLTPSNERKEKKKLEETSPSELENCPSSFPLPPFPLPFPLGWKSILDYYYY